MEDKKRVWPRFWTPLAGRGLASLARALRAAGLVVAVLCVLAPGIASASGPYIALLDTFEEVLAPESGPGAVSDPFIMYDPEAPGAAEHGPYRLWFLATDTEYIPCANKHWIGHAWSWDGVHFTTREIVHTADPRGDEIGGCSRDGNPLVTKTENGYRLYHFGYDPWVGRLDISLNSQDGINYTSHIAHAMDVLWSGGWDYDILDPGTMLQEDGRYVLYYGARGPSRTADHLTIGRAVSEDGLVWPDREIISADPHAVSRQQVLAMGEAGQWDRNLLLPSVFGSRNGQDGYGTFFLAGTGDPAWVNMSIGFASSPDGINWSERTLVFSTEDLGGATGLSMEAVWNPRYFYDPQSGVEYLYFTYHTERDPRFINAKIGRVRLVPEPASLSLLALGGLSLLGYAWRRRKRTA